MGRAELDLAEALEGAADGAFVVGPDGSILAWNPAAEKILGHRASETLGRQCCEVLAGQDTGGRRVCRPGCHVMILAREGSAAESFDLRALTKASRPVWLNVSTLTSRRTGRTLVAHLFRDVTTAREVPAPKEPPDSLLTRRELQVLTLLALGVSTRDMAERLGVSQATIRNHVQSILGKLGVHSRLEAVALVRR